MNIVKSLIAPAFLAVALTSASGCGAATTTPLTGRQIAANAVSAYQNVKTFNVDMNMTMGMNVEGGQQPMKIDMKAGATGAMDIAGTRLKMQMNVDMNVPVVGKQNTSTELYVLDNWLYSKVTVPDSGDQWVKTKLSPAMWQQQNQLDQQIEMLKTAVDVASVGEETIDGTVCYVLSVTPDMAALSGYLASELAQGSASGILNNADLSRVFKSVAVKEWISKRDYLPMKVDMNMSLEMLPGDVGAKSTDLTRMTMNMTVQGNYHDYNKPVTVTLPAGAESAKETPATTTTP